MTQLALQVHHSVDNTLGLSCVAGNSIRAPDQETVLKAVQWALVHDLPVLPLGAGSNVILPPELGALALHLVDGSVRELQRDAQSVTLRVGAGKNWHELVEETLAAGFFGLENLALIPGLVGAAPVQNIGAYGVELSAFVKVVHGVDLAEPQIRSIGAAECAFAYRDSVFKQGLAGRFVITAVDFRLALVPQLKLSYPALKERLLVNADTADAAAVCARVMELRRERLPDPALQPNAGSFFKNPLVSPALAKRLGELYPSMPCFPAGERARKLSAAWLIERCGFKGERRGPVGVSDKHALVVVNFGGATQSDVLSLALEIQGSVRDRFDCCLDVEPRIYSAEGVLLQPDLRVSLS